jgi:hypothetical protein
MCQGVEDRNMTKNAQVEKSNPRAISLYADIRSVMVYIKMNWMKGLSMYRREMDKKSRPSCCKYKG